MSIDEFRHAEHIRPNRGPTQRRPLTHTLLHYTEKEINGVIIKETILCSAHFLKTKLIKQVVCLYDQQETVTFGSRPTESELFFKFNTLHVIIIIIIIIIITLFFIQIQVRARKSTLNKTDHHTVPGSYKRSRWPFYKHEEYFTK